jgi:hypothetical protein
VKNAGQTSVPDQLLTEKPKCSGSGKGGDEQDDPTSQRFYIAHEQSPDHPQAKQIHDGMPPSQMDEVCADQAPPLTPDKVTPVVFQPSGCALYREGEQQADQAYSKRAEIVSRSGFEGE